MNPSRRILLASSLILALTKSGLANADDKIPVAASFSILGDLVRVVGGDRVAVTTLVGPDQDAHAFEPRPADARTLLATKLFVTNGLSFEPWATRLAQATGYRGATVVASKGVKPIPSGAPGNHGSHRHETADPHAWQDPENVVLYVRNIAAGLSGIDPQGANGYQANAEAYAKELRALDAWAREQFAAIPLDKRKVITSHDAFGYLAARYQIRFLAPQGVNTDAAPGARQVARLIEQILREKIKAVFVENMSNPKLIEQLAKDTGVAVGARLYADALSSAGQPGSSYLLMMRHNVAQLAAGMKLN
ncbi:MAG: metal ABC transporter substrate-binding protein [Burkholderiaceae bacterium]|nr:metal ABC transporter substrate-binding protein [Burkholderiaceae bacterium]